jgi:hypothetical protein
MQWLPPPNAHLSMLGRFIAYPVGKVLLRCLTLGRYPPENRPHNALFVALTPWWFFCIVAVVAFS